MSAAQKATHNGLDDQQSHVAADRTTTPEPSSNEQHDPRADDHDKASHVHSESSDVEDEDGDDEEEDEPHLKYDKLTAALVSVYRNGDATSSLFVAGDKMILGTHNGNIHTLALP
ncbi:hypothetical protein KCU77_g18625, partial [Aureobasidium melanogenum]